MENNSHKPKISVVMPIYNRMDFGRHAIQSILDQTFSEWELIIIDDGSTDRTLDMIRSFAKQDKRIRVYQNKVNKGISFSRNKGNKLARAPIIVVQDSDDMSFPDRLERINEYFTTHPDTEYLYHSLYTRAVDIRYGQRGIHRELVKSGVYDKRRAITIPYIPGQSAYTKKAALGTPYRESLIAWDDWGLIIDFTMRNRVFGYIDRPLYEYVVSEDSITTASDTNGAREKDKETLKNIMRTEYHLTVND